jgi:hypothetical protein
LIPSCWPRIPLAIATDSSPESWKLPPQRHPRIQRGVAMKLLHRFPKVDAVVIHTEMDDICSSKPCVSSSNPPRCPSEWEFSTWRLTQRWGGLHDLKPRPACPPSTLRRTIRGFSFQLRRYISCGLARLLRWDGCPVRKTRSLEPALKIEEKQKPAGEASPLLCSVKIGRSWLSTAGKGPQLAEPETAYFGRMNRSAS